MRSYRFIPLKFTCILVAVLLLMVGVLACSASEAGVKKVSSEPTTVLSIAGGKVQVLAPNAKEWAAAEEGIVLEQGASIRTETGANAVITFFDGSTIQLNGDTAVTLDTLMEKTSSSPKMIKLKQDVGETASRVVKMVDSKSSYEIETTAAVAAVRGSEMVVQVARDGATKVYNVEGTIAVTAQGKEVAIPVGSASSVTPGAAPGAPEPAAPPSFIETGLTTVTSVQGWQQTSLQLKAGDKFTVEYSGGSWAIDYRNFPFVGPAGYSADIDKTIAAGYKFDSSVPYGFLLGKVGEGKIIHIGGDTGPREADADGFLYLRINDLDSSLVDNNGSISVIVKSEKPQMSSASSSAFDEFSIDKGNPNGVWSYGWMPTDFSKFNLYTKHSTYQWYGPQGGDRTPSIWTNSSGRTSYGVPDKWLSMHPGPGTEPSVLRWTAPKDGQVTVTGEFLAGDAGAMTVAVRHNNQESWKATDAGKFNLSLKVATGETIDFVVYGGYGYGNTPVGASMSY
jgi:hypothetical protein